MNAVSIIGLCFSGFVLLCSVLTIIFTSRRNLKRDTKEDEQELYSLREGIFKANIKLEQICSTTNETRADIKAMDQKVIHQGEEIAVIKRDLETAFMRIDELRENKEDKK